MRVTSIGFLFFYLFSYILFFFFPKTEDFYNKFLSLKNTPGHLSITFWSQATCDENYHILNMS
jgi:hypothetical protein